MRIKLLAGFIFLISYSFAQKTDSLHQVYWESALKKLNAGDYNDAAVQLTQLINSDFSNKEVYVKRGVAYYNLKDYQKLIKRSAPTLFLSFDSFKLLATSSLRSNRQNYTT